MKWFRGIIVVILQNIRKWKYDCRIWIAALLLLIFIHSYTKGLSDFCTYFQTKSSPWIFPFIYMQYYTKLLFFFPLILIFSNAPFIDNNQLYVITRIGKIRWCIGQILYIILGSAIYFIFIILSSIVLNIDCVEYSSEWGKVLNTLANTNAGTQFQIEFSVDKNVLNLFTPGQAIWYTFLHSWISGTILGLLIFLFNMLIKGSGTLITSLVLVFSATATKNIALIKFSPVTWSTLNYIQLQFNDGLPSYNYISIVYSVVTILLIVSILVISKKCNLDNNLKR